MDFLVEPINDRSGRNARANDDPSRWGGSQVRLHGSGTNDLACATETQANAVDSTGSCGSL
jgi:hypothetical protein